MISHEEENTDEQVLEVVGSWGLEAVGDMEQAAKGALDPFAKGIERIRELDGLNQSQKNRLTRQIGAQGTSKRAHTKQNYDKYETGYAWFDVVEPPFNMIYLSKLYDVSAAHHSAVNAKVVNTVGLGYEWRESLLTEEKLDELKDDEARSHRFMRKVERAKRQLNDLVENLNSEDTLEEILWKVWTDYETLGNGYIEVGRTVTGKIGFIGHIPATTIRRRAKRDGYIQIVANKITFFRNYGDLKTSDPIGQDRRPNEIIHFAKYTPSESYYGVPDIVSARNAVAGSEFAERFNLDFFEHKAVPRYMIILKGAKIPAEAEKRIREFFAKGLKGQHHRTVLLQLPADKPDSKVEFRIEPVESKITDASFVKYIEHNRDAVFMAHRVPISQTGLNQNVSLGAVRDATRMFKEQVIRPQQRVAEKKLQPLFREITNVFDFKLVELTLTDAETQSKIDERYLRWDTVDPNEVRKNSLNMKPRDGGHETVGVHTQSQEREQRAQAAQSRTRDAERTGGPDDTQSAETRNPKGEGSDE